MSDRAEYQRRYRAKRKAAGIPLHSTERLVKQSVWLSETYHRLRAELYEIVGKRCVGCGHVDLRVMEFDHIADDGAADRRRFLGARSMLSYYVGRPEEARRRLQTLCRNCNWLKRRGLPKGREWNERP